MSEAQAVLVEDKKPTRKSEQREEDYMSYRIRRLIELEKKGETLDSSRLNRGLDSEVAARVAKVRQTIDRELTERAESHQEGFHKKRVQLGLTKTDAGPVHAEIPQAGSGTEGRKRILEHLRAMASVEKTNETLSLWMAQLGLGCALLAVCWVGGRLGRKGWRTFRGNEDDSRAAKPYNASRRENSNPRRETPTNDIDSEVNQIRARQDEVCDSLKPRIISQVEIIERIGLEPWKALDTLASLISQSSNPEARLETVIKTLELKARIMLKRKFPDTRITEVEERDDDSEEESGSSMSSTSYSTDMRIGDEDKEPEKDTIQMNPQLEGGARPKGTKEKRIFGRIIEKRHNDRTYERSNVQFF